MIPAFALLLAVLAGLAVFFWWRLGPGQAPVAVAEKIGANFASLGVVTNVSRVLLQWPSREGGVLYSVSILTSLGASVSLLVEALPSGELRSL